MGATDTFHDLERKQAFDGVGKEVHLEPSKENSDLEFNLDDIRVYVHPQMEKILCATGRAIIFWRTVHVNSNAALVKDVE